MKTIALFDIDGTILHASGGRHAMDHAFEECVGSKEYCAFSFGGMTDMSIARKGLINAGLEATQARMDALLDVYLRELEQRLAATQSTKVYDGVVELIDALRADSNVAVGLGTGNLKRGAFIKLGAVNLHDRFSFGGYCCDHEHRPTLIGVGADRGAAALGIARDQARIVVIGDTPLDVEAGHANGAYVIGVSTGTFSADQLRSAKADLVVESLTDARVRGVFA